MKLNEFVKKMQKPCFTLEEAHRVGWETSPNQLKVQLHHWCRQGELLRFKRGVYGFPDRIRDKVEVAKILYGPSYISLEYALHAHGFIPDVPFSMTLVTPRLTRKFQTPYGEFFYHKIHQKLFWGFDPQTLMAEKEKALLDYFYFHRHHLKATPLFWREERFQNVGDLDVKKLKVYARQYPEKVGRLLTSFLDYRTNYGKSQKNN